MGHKFKSIGKGSKTIPPEVLKDLEHQMLVRRINASLGRAEQNLADELGINQKSAGPGDRIKYPDGRVYTIGPRGNLIREHQRG